MKKVNIYNNCKKLDINNPLKVSVIIPNYNYENFIIERIDSILLQTYPIYELIILDDKSTDNSVKVIEEKIKTIKDIKVKFIKNDVNSGMVFSQWQKGLKNITGDYFWIAEADDSCDNKFLEKLIKPFVENEDLVLSYSESMKINENNEIIGNDCRDWADIFKTGKWNDSYICSGKEEILNSLSYNNSILNVSSIVWKYNKKLFDIFEEAKEYKVAGDWYIYVKVLKNGGIAYNSESLNYFRKHSKSVSTIIKKNIEYKEVLMIQDYIKNNYNLSKDILEKQILRRKLMGFCENKKNVNKKGNVAWVIPGLLKGSGGHRTIIQNINALIKDGYQCDIYVEDYENLYPIELAKKINEFYGNCDADVYSGWQLTKKYDVCVATAFNTVETVMKADCDKRVYFVQDYEPYFFSMGDYYIQAENSYKNDINVITIGKWLSAKMSNEYNLKSNYFNFCADLNIYKQIKSITKENAICYIFQPNKPRRCDSIGLKALQIVKKIKPDIKIYLYGSEKCDVNNLEVEHLGIIPIEKCNELYNKCKVGLCLSASNPSRIPFEMMAAGLPVVEMYRENNLYDFPNDGCLLADSKPEAIAAAIIKILDDTKLQKQLSKNGIKFMKDYPLEKGYEQFLENFNEIVFNKKIKVSKIEKAYTKDIELSTKETEIISKNINSVVTFTKPKEVLLKQSIIRKIFRKLRRFLRKIKRKIFK
ncbi:MAG: glycosyltransferase [Bacilli bacterium]